MTICPVPGCGNRTHGGRCPTHSTTHIEQQRRNRHPRRKVYDSRRWRRCRTLVLQLADHRCAVCGDTATIADHYPIPVGGILAQGGDPCDPTTCRALCHRCSGKADGQRGGGLEARLTPTRLAGTAQSVQAGAKNA